MTYTIKFTKSSGYLKSDISVPDATTNSTDTSLELMGKGVSPFGEKLWTNMVHMLEHFCSDAEPAHKTTGQVWYDSTNKKLKVCEEDSNGTGHVWTELGGSGTTPSTSYFTTGTNGLELATYDLSLAHSLAVNGSLTISGDSTVQKLTAKKAIISDIKNPDDTYMNMITSDDVMFKPYFITKEYADEHYLKGTNLQNAHEFDVSYTFDSIKLPGSVLFTGNITEQSVSIVCAANSNFIDVSGDIYKEGTVFNVTGFQGSATLLPTIKLPSALDYNGQRITVAIHHDTTTTNGRNKVLHAVDMSTGGSGQEIAWVGGTGPTTSTAAMGDVDIVEFRSIGNKWYGVVIGIGFK